MWGPSLGRPPWLALSTGPTSCGMALPLPEKRTYWKWNRPLLDFQQQTAGDARWINSRTAGHGKRGACASTGVPWGMDAIRTTVLPSAGSNVFGTTAQIRVQGKSRRSHPKPVADNARRALRSLPVKGPDLVSVQRSPQSRASLVLGSARENGLDWAAGYGRRLQVYPPEGPPDLVEATS